MITYLFFFLIPLFSCQKPFLEQYRILSSTNILPSIVANSQYYSVVNSFFSFQLTISDANDDTLEKILKQNDGSDIPSWLSWTSSNNSISGLSATNQILYLVLNVSDGTGSVTKEITLSINPILTNTESKRDIIAYVTSSKYIWQVPYTGFSGNNLKYNIQPQSGTFPDWIDYTSNSNSITINKHKNNKYPINLTLSVKDSAFQSIESDFTITSRNTNAIQDVIALDFGINSTPDQQNIDFLLLLPNQNIMAIWESYMEDGSDFGIFGKLLDSQGDVIKSQFRINSHTDNSQSFPQYAILSNGSILIAWESTDQDGSNIGIYAKIFDGNGNVVRDEFRINSFTDDEQSTVYIVAGDNGNIVFVWQSYNQDGSKYGIFAKVIKQDGSDLKSDFQVNDWTNDSQKNAKIIKLSDGSVLIVWMSRYQDGDGYGIYGKIITANGDEKVGETRINSYTSGDQVNHNLIILKNNNVLITWESFQGDGSGNGLYGLIIDSSFNIVKSEFRLNDYTYLEQRNIQMATLPNGNLFMTWESQRQPSNSFGIFGKIIDENGDKVVDEFHVNDFYLANQGFSQVAVIDEKLVFVGWESQGQDASGAGIYYKLFDFNGHSITNEQRLNNYVGGWQINLKILPLSDKKLMLAWNRDIGGYDFDCYGQVRKFDYNFIPDVYCEDVTISANSKKKFDYDVVSDCFFDYDGSDLTISVSFSNGTNLPSWITYNSQEMKLTGLIPENLFQNFSISITATDDNEDSNSLVIDIMNTNVEQSRPKSSSEEEGINMMIIGAAAGGLILLILIIICLIRRRKKINGAKKINDIEASKIQPVSSPGDNDILTTREQNNVSRNPFITTNVPQKYLCPLTGGIMSEPWLVIFNDDTRLTFEKEPLFNYFNLHQTIPVKNKPKKYWEENSRLKEEIENYLLNKTPDEFAQDRDLLFKCLEWIQLRGRSKLMKSQKLKKIIAAVENKIIPG